jgi:hypothetical protein
MSYPSMITTSLRQYTKMILTKSMMTSRGEKLAKIKGLIKVYPGISHDRISEKMGLSLGITGHYLCQLYGLSEIAMTMDGRYYPIDRDGDDSETIL